MAMKQPKYVDFEEFRAGGKPGHRMRASRDGVRIEAQPARILGHEQARLMGETIIKAADEAKKRGAYPALME